MPGFVAEPDEQDRFLFEKNQKRIGGGMKTGELNECKTVGIIGMEIPGVPLARYCNPSALPCWPMTL